MTITALGVRGASGAAGAGTITSPSWSSTIGSTLVVIVNAYSVTTAASGDITDSKGNPYTLAVDGYAGVLSTPGNAVYYNIAGLRGASHTVTANIISSVGSLNISVLELSSTGVIAFDSTTRSTAADGTSPFALTAGGAISGSQVAIGACTLDTGGTSAWTMPTGYSVIYEETNGATFLVSNTCYKIGETGTPSIQWSNADSLGAGGARQLFATFVETPFASPPEYGLVMGSSLAHVGSSYLGAKDAAITVPAKLNDRYSRTSGTISPADSGQSYDLLPSGAGFNIDPAAPSGMRVFATAGNNEIAVVDMGTPNVLMSVDIVTGSSNTNHGLFARATDDLNGIYLNLTNVAAASVNQLQLGNFVAGNNTNFATALVSQVTLFTNYHIDWLMMGGTHWVWVNNVLVVNGVIDGTWLWQTKHGLGIYPGGSNENDTNDGGWSNLSIVNLAGVPPETGLTIGSPNAHIGSSYIGAPTLVSTTVVGNQLDTRWTVRQAVADSNNLRWSVRTTLGDQEDIRWAVRTKLGDQEDFRWTVRAVVNDSADLRWQVKQAIADSSDLRWAVRTRLGDQEDFRWSVRTFVGDQEDFRWAVRAAIGDQEDLRWQVKKAVNDSNDIRWAIRTVLGDQEDFRWAVRTTVNDSSDFRWSVRSLVNDSSDIRWAVRSRIADSNDIRWAVRTILGDTTDLRWAVRVFVSDSNDLRWAVRAKVPDSIDLRWGVRAAVGDSNELRWAVRAIAGDQTDLRWQVLSTAVVADDVNLQWTVRALVNDSLDTRWAVRTKVADSSDLRWDVRALVNDSIDIRWQVLAIVPISDDLDLRWAVRTKVGDQQDLTWSIRSLLGNSLDTRWVLRALASDDLDLRWRTLGPGFIVLTIQVSDRSVLNIALRDYKHFSIEPETDSDLIITLNDR